tara:strand:- start:1662 stop:1985 length:324 start_codon:yes stop_codon:yes gene_type:complete
MEQSNKLIAEFMGHKVNFGFKKDGVLFLGHHIGLDKLKYDSSWDWLMSVVDKIESLGYEVQIRNTDCIIFQLLDNFKYKPIVDISSENGKMNSTYKAVVEFIKNQND